MAREQLAAADAFHASPSYAGLQSAIIHCCEERI
jgi:hypothetical protein